ncbi:DUF2971 domain-containing protein [Aeromonas veronii]
MKILYKYLPDTFSLEKHISEPSIKLSPITDLNDPFEGQMTKNALDMVYNIILNQAKYTPIDPIYRESKDIFSFAWDFLVKTICITSFSETQRNLLMWSHYASQHKGICIGYDVDMLSEESDNHELKKVNYDTTIFEPELLDELKNIKNIFSADFKPFLDRLVTTKSNDWSYEKEHRYISNAESASKIIINNKLDALCSSSKEILNLIKTHNTHDIIEHDEYIELCSKRECNNINSPHTNTFEIEAVLTNTENVLFLKKIKKENIKRIYFGIFYDEDKINPILDKIRSDAELSHISVYKYEMSDERYELNPVKLI